MTKSKSSDMIRVLNELIPGVKKLNELYRSGHTEAVQNGLQLLIGAVERGETFGDATIAHRLSQLERIAANLNHPVAPIQTTQPAIEILTEAELIARLKLPGHWQQYAKMQGKIPDRWLCDRAGAGTTYLGNGRYQCSLG